MLFHEQIRLAAIVSGTFACGLIIISSLGLIFLPVSLFDAFTCLGISIFTFILSVLAFKGWFS